MIGLGIILLASIMNAAGLNLTKLDHVTQIPLFVFESCGNPKPLGSDSSCTESIAEKGLASATMAFGNGAIHVRCKLNLL